MKPSKQKRARTWWFGGIGLVAIVAILASIAGVSGRAGGTDVAAAQEAVNTAAANYKSALQAFDAAQADYDAKQQEADDAAAAVAGPASRLKAAQALVAKRQGQVDKLVQRLQRAKPKQKAVLQVKLTGARDALGIANNALTTAQGEYDGVSGTSKTAAQAAADANKIMGQLWAKAVSAREALDAASAKLASVQKLEGRLADLTTQLGSAKTTLDAKLDAKKSASAAYHKAAQDARTKGGAIKPAKSARDSAEKAATKAKADYDAASAAWQQDPTNATLGQAAVDAGTLMTSTAGDLDKAKSALQTAKQEYKGALGLGKKLYKSLQRVKGEYADAKQEVARLKAAIKAIKSQHKVKS